MSEKLLISIPFQGDTSRIEKSLQKLEEQKYGDVLIVDDGSGTDIYDLIRSREWIRYIRHDMSIGYGGALISALKYARDNTYDIVVNLDPENLNYLDDLPGIMENMKYGFDVVSCSRILENFDYNRIDDSVKSQVMELSGSLKQATGLDITDPLSGILSFRVESMKSMELTEFSHAVFLQIWIQSAYYGLTVIEIPSRSEARFGREFELHEDSLGYFLSIVETEKYLYTKGSIN